MYTTLISAEQLQALITSARPLRIFDCSFELMKPHAGKEQFLQAHIPGAVHIPLSELEARALELPEDRTIVTFCTGGLISTGAANLLTELGFTAVNLARGLIEWRAAGGALEGVR